MKLQQQRPKVSVCVVTYNQEEYIRQCLQSIVDQHTSFDFELIVGDDNSTDGTRAIVESFELRYPEILKPIYHKKNIGAFKNYLEVHRAATGEYVCHIDGDDWARPKKLITQSNHLDENSGCILVAHRMGIWDTNRKVALTRDNPQVINLSQLLRLHPMFLNSSIMYRRIELGDIFHSDLDFIDFYVYVSAAQRGSIHFISEVLGDYRKNVGISSSRNLMPYIQAAIDHAAKGIGETREVKRCRAKSYLSYAIAALCANEINVFHEYLAASTKADKFWVLPRVIYVASVVPTALRKLILVYKNRSQIK